MLLLRTNDSCTTCMFLVLTFFLNTFPMSSNIILWDVFTGFDRVVCRGLSRQVYNELHFVALSDMLCKTSNGIILIEGIPVGTLSLY